jgi:4-aminobutyrate aminotransferase-like enzyme
MMVRGEGAYVFDEDGNRLLDAGSHRRLPDRPRPGRVAKRIADQVQLEFIALDAGISHIYVARRRTALGIVMRRPCSRSPTRA